jgi:hypothetical protein
MKTDRILKLMKFLFWVIFINLCLRTGFEIFYIFFSPFGNLESTKEVYLNLNLSEYSQLRTTLYYIIIKTLIITIYAAKTYLAYLVTKIFTKIDFNNPFTINTSKLLIKISYVALGTGILALISNGFNMWLDQRDFLSVLLEPYEKGSSEFLFLGTIIFIIAQVFKKGTKIQSENELTV